MTEGEIRLCAHCKGLGVCCTAVGKFACLACLNHAGVPMQDAPTRYREVEGVACSACSGRGNIWIGPNSVVCLGSTPGGHLSLVKGNG